MALDQVVLTINATGDVLVDLAWGPGGGARYYVLGYFSGSPPFPCYDISELQIDISSSSICGDPPEYIIVDNAAA